MGGIPNTFPDHRAIEPSDEAQGVWIDSTPHLITGELESWSATSKVKPTRIPGYWCSKKGVSTEPKMPVMPGEKVFLYFHGGGYVLLSAHPRAFTSNILRPLLELNDTVPRAFSVEYRLSSGNPLPDQYPFPAALLDALAGYNYLVNVVGYNPSNVIMVGDSAGANLALALTRYLIEYKGTTDDPLPSPPSALLLISPWVDASDSHDGPGSSNVTNYGDIIEDLTEEKGFPVYAKRAFLGPYGSEMAATNPYISPASLHPLTKASFTGFPRTFIQAGGAERLLDSIRTLRDKMVADMGEDEVTYYEAPDGVHDCLIFPSDPVNPPILKAIQQWIA